MTYTKNLVKNISVLNVLLAASIVFAFIYIFFPLLTVSTIISLPAEKKELEHISKIEAEIAYPSSSDYILVADDNLFHPERKIPPEKKTEEKPLPKPEFVLYGTLISSDLQIAYIEDLKEPRITKGRGKRQIPLRKGDTMSGFVLKEIVPEKVMMIRGDEKIIVQIHDQNYKKSISVQEPSTKGTPKKVVPPEIQAALPPQPTNYPPPKSPTESVIFDYFHEKRNQ